MSSNKEKHFLGLYNISLFHNKSSGMHYYLEGMHLALAIPKPKKVKKKKKEKKKRKMKTEKGMLG
jgi:hypothetical protein